MQKIVVVGGGASGIVAAITASRLGAKVTLIEHNNKIGKKILSTGNGRCNLTNAYLDSACYHSDDIKLVETVLKKFGTTETQQFFEELGVLLKTKNGCFYPRSEQASAIVAVLDAELKKQKITVLLESHVSHIRKEETTFVVETNANTLRADAVILSAGGMAAKALGADGSGYVLAKSLEHHISPVVPALVQLRSKETYFKQLAGVRTDATVTAVVNGSAVATDTGELQLTDYGLSGIPIFQISRHITKALLKKKKVAVEIDFLPQKTDKELTYLLREIQNRHGERTAHEMLSGLFNSKLNGVLLSKSQIPKEVVSAKLTDEQLHALVQNCKRWCVPIYGANTFEQAQVCAGGVSTAELNGDTLESIYTKKLYITGELLDVDGICGGYNLQWAWATGYLAGTAAAKEDSF